MGRNRVSPGTGTPARQLGGRRGLKRWAYHVRHPRQCGARASPARTAGPPSPRPLPRATVPWCCANADHPGADVLACSFSYQGPAGSGPTASAPSRAQDLSWSDVSPPAWRPLAAQLQATSKVAPQKPGRAFARVDQDGTRRPLARLTYGWCSDLLNYIVVFGATTAANTHRVVENDRVIAGIFPMRPA